MIYHPKNPLTKKPFWVLLQLVLLGIILLIHHCILGPKNTFKSPPSASRRYFSVMSYNVENLFDTVHDEGKEDYTFLPLKLKKELNISHYCEKQKPGFRKTECYELNWDFNTLRHKFLNLCEVIFQVHGKGPDILILQEVENLNVLKQWNEACLHKGEYVSFEIEEGDDPRGIDVAVVSRFPTRAPSRLIRWWKETTSTQVRPTRGFLHVRLLVFDKYPVDIIGVHLPSAAAPTAVREAALEQLSKLIQSIDSHVYWIIGGDFNINVFEDSEHRLVERYLEPLGLVSHKVGCHRCRGTHNYRKTWSFLDMLVFSPLFEGPPLKLNKSSITTPMWAKNQTRLSGRPRRFDPENPHEGVSDHLPIYAEVDVIAENP